MFPSHPVRRRVGAAAGALLVAGVLAVPAGASAAPVRPVQFHDVAHAEGDTGTQAFTTPVHLECTDGSPAPLPATATCQFDLGIDKADVGAVALVPEDFLLTFDSTKKVTLNGGESRDVDLTVDVVGDTAVEPDETYNLGYSMSVENPVTGFVTDDTGVGVAGTIINDDKAPAPVKVSAAPAPAPAPATAPAPSAAPLVRPAATGGPAVDEAGPRMGIVFSGMNTALKARVRCPRDEESCTGRLAVRLNGTTLAAARFDLAGGRSRLLRIKLTRAQRRSLRRAGVVDLKTTAVDAAGNRQARELSFEL